MNTIQKIEHVGFLCGKYDLDITFNGNAFMNGNTIVCGIDKIDSLIDMIESEFCE